MKSTGIVRNTDKVGRIVLPIELRQTLYIAEGDPLEIYTEEDKIILKKLELNVKINIFEGGAK